MEESQERTNDDWPTRGGKDFYSYDGREEYGLGQERPTVTGGHYTMVSRKDRMKTHPSFFYLNMVMVGGS